MQSIKQDNIQKLEDKLKVKCNDCMKQFEGYTQQERNYNEKYMVYRWTDSNDTEISILPKPYRFLQQDSDQWVPIRNGQEIPILFQQLDLNHHLATDDRRTAGQSHRTYQRR